MNKHITPKEVPYVLVEEERRMLMWEWQSPPVPACNHKPFDPDNALPVPRYKGAPQEIKSIDERRKNWKKRDFF